MASCEIDPDAPLTVLERICVAAILAFAVVVLFACFTNAWGR